MPFRSQAQFRKFQAMLERGEISRETFDKFMRETKVPISQLPERSRSARMEAVRRRRRRSRS